MQKASLTLCLASSSPLQFPTIPNGGPLLPRLVQSPREGPGGMAGVGSGGQDVLSEQGRDHLYEVSMYWMEGTPSRDLQGPPYALPMHGLED